MRSTINWIKKHRFLTVLLCIFLFSAPLIIIQFLFKWHSGLEWLEAEWGAGDLLAYIAGFEALLGTIILGFITVYQSQVANEVNERLSKENNNLQKISIQQMLPLLKVSSLSVEKSTKNTSGYAKSKQNTVEVSETVTPTNREIMLRTFLLESGKDELYKKRVKVRFENISNSPISKIAIDQIEFSGFQFKGEYVNEAVCKGLEKANCISWLLFPQNSLDIVVEIYFNQKLYLDFWEYRDSSSVGTFDMCLFLTNTSLSGVEYKERIFIEEPVEFQGKIMYKGYEEDANV